MKIQTERGIEMGMTDKQLKEYRKTLLMLILEMLKNSKDLTDLKIKIEALISKD